MLALDILLKRLIKHGQLVVVGPAGDVGRYGDGTGPNVTVRLHGRSTPTKLLLNPEAETGEAFMDGRLELEKGDIYDLLDLVMSNARWAPAIGPLARFNLLGRNLSRRFAQYNPMRLIKRKIARHYDLSDELFELFLDRDRQYSCAYFVTPSDTLEEAQAQKKRHIAAKLLLKPGLRVLDIGSGWGGLGLYMARATGADVTGITLSEEQLKVSNKRAQEALLADRVRFNLADYRQETGRYDRVVSIGMLEHVGINHFDAYFKKVASLLTDDGVALIHAIGRSDGPGSTNPWIRKYIFPGGYSPALSEVLPSIERAGLIVSDIEILRLHYAETLKAWRERFNQHRDQIRAIYDERFCRMWEFYLAASEASFRYGGLMVFQIQLTRSLGAVPLTRDYITEAERTLPLDLPVNERQAAE